MTAPNQVQQSSVVEIHNDGYTHSHSEQYSLYWLYLLQMQRSSLFTTSPNLGASASARDQTASPTVAT